MNNLKKYLVFACMSVVVLMSACQGKYDIEKFPPVINKFDKSKPVALNAIKPDYGAINHSFIVEGNFPGGVSDVKIYFADKQAVILSNDGHTISGLVPRQEPGYNSISFVADGDSVVLQDSKFKYSQSKLVTLVAGAMGDRKYTNGDIYTARFTEPTGVGAVKGLRGDNVIVIEGWWEKRVRLVSLDDNQVTALETGVSYSGPAVTSNRERFWLIGMFGTKDGTQGIHNLKYFDRSEGWVPKSTGLELPKTEFPGKIWGTTFVNDDDRYLYAMDGEANIVRIDTETNDYLIINNEKEATLLPEWYPPTDRSWHDRSDLIWSDYHQCFFACLNNYFAVYKLTWKNKDSSTNTLVWELYAGTPKTNDIKWGHRLNDARMRNPYALCASSTNGDIYVVHRENYNFISRITGDQFELAVGIPGRWGNPYVPTGDPLEVTLDQPQDMCEDSEGNFYIADGNSRALRKLTIE